MDLLSCRFLVEQMDIWRQVELEINSRCISQFLFPEQKYEGPLADRVDHIVGTKAHTAQKVHHRSKQS